MAVSIDRRLMAGVTPLLIIVLQTGVIIVLLTQLYRDTSPLSGKLQEHQPFDLSTATPTPTPTDTLFTRHGQTGMYAEIQLYSDFSPVDGSLRIPEQYKRIWIEIGANSRDLARDVVLKQKPADIFLITFEPLLDKYSAIASWNTRADSRRTLGYACDHCIVFPLAVSNMSGYATFHVATVDGCSSLLPMKMPEKHLKDDWKTNFLPRCAKAQEERRVPTVSFEHVLQVWLKGREVEWTKIDAQGADLFIVEAAGAGRRQLKSVSLEVTNDVCDTMYHGAVTCTPMMKRMLDFGFTTTQQCATIKWNGNGGCESEEVKFQQK